ncbi:MAG: LamG-like jellyroll fold domain-containing protein [Phycisphaerae bacterium]
MSRYTLMSCSALAVVMSAAVPAMASIVVIHQWDMGASEVAGGNGNVIGQQLPVGGSQTDLVGGANAVNLSNELGGSGLYTGPIYTSNAAPGNSVAVQFTGDAGQSLTAAGAFNLTSNFGFQLWVDPTDTNNRMIAYDGSSGSNGWGLVEYGGHLDGLLGGVAFVNGPTINPGTWTNLALVVDGQSNATTLYVNGLAYATVNSMPVAPTVDSSGFGFYVGSDVGLQTAYSTVDNVRVFTFAPGAFSASDLAEPGLAVPEPASLPLLAMGVVGLLLLQRKRVA